MPPYFTTEDITILEVQDQVRKRAKQLAEVKKAIKEPPLMVLVCILSSI